MEVELALKMCHVVMEELKLSKKKTIKFYSIKNRFLLS